MNERAIALRLARERTRERKAVLWNPPPTDLHRQALERLKWFWSENPPKFADFDTHTVVVFEDDAVRLRIYTAKYLYSFVVSIKPDEPIEEWYLGGYLGGRVLKPMADYTGGNDLADGRFTMDTWSRIMADALGSELEPVKEDVKANPEWQEIWGLGPGTTKEVAASDKASVMAERCMAYERRHGSVEFVKRMGSALNRLLVDKGLVSVDELRDRLMSELEMHTAAVPSGDSREEFTTARMDAETNLKRVKAAIARLVRMQKRSPEDWGYVGTMIRVGELLAEAANSVPGRQP